MNIFRTFSVAIIAFVVIFASYFFIMLGGDETGLPFMGGSSSGVSTTTFTNTQKQISDYLNEFSSAQLDVDFYTGTSSVSVAFSELKNYKEPIPTLNIGRENPFEPVD